MSSRKTTAKKGRLARLQAMVSLEALTKKIVSPKKDDISYDYEETITEEECMQPNEEPSFDETTNTILIEEPYSSIQQSRPSTIKKGRLKKIDQALNPDRYRNEHRRVRTKSCTKNFHCNTCKKSFARAEKLKIHQATHLTREEREAMKQYQCDYCPKKFIDMSKLKVHRDFKHLKQYKHICETCGKPFVNSSELNKHVTFSHGERKPCIICGKNVLNIENHIKEVHESLPKTCEYCGEVLPNQKKLNKHRYMKHPMHEYECQICEKIFSDKFFYKQHMNNRHNIVIEEID